MLRKRIWTATVMSVLAVCALASDASAQTIPMATSGWTSTYWNCDVRQNCGLNRFLTAYTRPDWRVTAYLTLFAGFANSDLPPGLLFDRLWAGYPRPDFLDGVGDDGPGISPPAHEPDLPSPGPGVSGPDVPSLVTPEPATMIMLATGLGGIGLSALRRRRKTHQLSADL